MGDDPNDSKHEMETVSFEDDAPTERIPLDSVSLDTNPTRAGVIDPALAESIRADYAPTMAEDDRMTFVGIVDAHGRILVPEKLLRAGAIVPGEELLVQTQKIS